MSLPRQEELREWFDYERKTGIFRWRKDMGAKRAKTVQEWRGAKA